MRSSAGSAARRACDGELRQAAREIARPDSGTVGRQHVAEPLRSAAGEEVPEPLHRRRVSPAAEHEGRAFPAPLEIQPGQRFGAAEVLRPDADEQRAVGVAAVAGEAAHPVGHDAVRLGGRRHDLPARAHAEGVDRPIVGAVVHQLVLGGAEARMPGGRAVLRAVDAGLVVLDTHAE